MRLLPLLIVIVVVAGCGGGDRITQTRAVAPFDRLEIADSVDVQVVPGDGREVRVYGGEDVLDRVETESSAGVLRIDVRDRGIVIGPDPLGDVRVQVAASELDRAYDDAQLVEAIGGDVRIVESSRDNLKITTPFDLRVAELLLK